MGRGRSLIDWASAVPLGGDPRPLVRFFRDTPGPRASPIRGAKSMSTPTEPKGPPAPAAMPGEAARLVPAWFPSWARDFAELYYAGTTCVFILHGNVHDLVRLGDTNSTTYGSL